jgi:uncharacterized FlaG/YvyC family protein
MIQPQKKDETLEKIQAERDKISAHLDQIDSELQSFNTNLELNIKTPFNYENMESKNKQLIEIMEGVQHIQANAEIVH